MKKSTCIVWLLVVLIHCGSSAAQWPEFIDVEMSAAQIDAGEEICATAIVGGRGSGPITVRWSMQVPTNPYGFVETQDPFVVNMVDGVTPPIVNCNLPSSCPGSYQARLSSDLGAGSNLRGSGVYTVANNLYPCWSWQRADSDTPLERYMRATGFDSDRQVAVVHGGDPTWTGQDARGDTWEWDGLRWLLRTISGPGPRFGHALAYDSNRRVMVLFGGVSYCFCYFEYCGCIPAADATWEWDGDSWTNAHADGPLSRFEPMMAFDRARGVVVLVESRDDMTWEWDGSRWRLTFVAFPESTLVGLAYDPIRRRVVGLTQDCRLWGWTGRLWIEEAPSWVCDSKCRCSAEQCGRPCLINCSGYLLTDPATDRVTLYNHGDRLAWTLTRSGWEARAMIDRPSPWQAGVPSPNRLWQCGPEVHVLSADLDGTWQLVSATDFDKDGDYDLFDVSQIYNCFGETQPFDACAGLDATDDEMVNLDDYGTCFSVMSGPG